MAKTNSPDAERAIALTMFRKCACGDINCLNGWDVRRAVRNGHVSHSVLKDSGLRMQDLKCSELPKPASTRLAQKVLAIAA